MTTSQRELLILLAKIVAANDVMSGSLAKMKIAELLAEINAGSQDIK